MLLVRRGKAPLAGEWSLPGGAVELGETLEEAIIREVAEETGLRVVPLQVVKAFDHIDRDAEGKVRFHYVLVDFLCRVDMHDGNKVLETVVLRHGSDVSEAQWVAVEGLRNSKEFRLTDRALDVIAIAWRVFGDRELER